MKSNGMSDGFWYMMAAILCSIKGDLINVNGPFDVVMVVIYAVATMVFAILAALDLFFRS